jgi:hypothetical protein
MTRPAASSVPLSTEARRGLRLFRQKLARDYAAFNERLERLSRNRDVAEFIMRGSVKGRQRALDRLHEAVAPATFEGAYLDGKTPIALWSILKPREAAIVDPKYPRDAQECVTFNYVMLGSPLKTTKPIAEGAWSMEITDHALGRMIERAPKAEHTGLIREAHRRLKNASRASLQDHQQANSQFLVPVSAGCFVCEMLTGLEISLPGIMIIVKVRTFLGSGMESDLPVVPQGQGAGRAGLSALIPFPLRITEKLGDGRIEATGFIPPQPELLGLVSGSDA